MVKEICELQKVIEVCDVVWMVLMIMIGKLKGCFVLCVFVVDVV